MQLYPHRDPLIDMVSDWLGDLGPPERDSVLGSSYGWIRERCKIYGKCSTAPTFLGLISFHSHSIKIDVLNVLSTRCLNHLPIQCSTIISSILSSIQISPQCNYTSYTAFHDLISTVDLNTGPCVRPDIDFLFKEILMYYIGVNTQLWCVLTIKPYPYYCL